MATKAEHLDPPSFLPAKRVTGLVIVPENEMTEANPLDLAWNASVKDLSTNLRGPPALQRRSSLNGNILQVTHPEDGAVSFFLQRKICKTAYGSVRVGFLLKQTDDEEDVGIEWDVVPSGGPYPFEMFAIKVQDKQRLLNSAAVMSAKVELAALKLVAEHNPDGNVDSSRYVCSDNNTAYAVCKFHGEGSLFQFVVENGVLSEPVARHFFKQILQGLKTLRELRLCHRNLNLESIMLRKSDCTISDLGSCLRIPEDGSPVLSPTMAAGTNPRYLPPEVVRTESFDGYGADLWAAGIMLCGMLFGTEAPFVWASPEDKRYQEICVKGNLKELYAKWEVHNPHKKAKATHVSDEALDLAQNILRAEPERRLTLDEVISHSWLQMETEEPKFPAPSATGLVPTAVAAAKEENAS